MEKILKASIVLFAKSNCVHIEMLRLRLPNKVFIFVEKFKIRCVAPPRGTCYKFREIGKMIEKDQLPLGNKRWTSQSVLR